MYLRTRYRATREIGQFFRFPPVRRRPTAGYDSGTDLPSLMPLSVRHWCVQTLVDLAKKQLPATLRRLAKRRDCLCSSVRQLRLLLLPEFPFLSHFHPSPPKETKSLLLHLDEWFSRMISSHFVDGSRRVLENYFSILSDSPRSNCPRI